MHADYRLDLKGLECPQPAIRTKRQLKQMASGQVLYVVCTDPMAAVDIPFVAQQLGHRIEQQTEDAGQLSFWLVVGGAARRSEASWPSE